MIIDRAIRYFLAGPFLICALGILLPREAMGTVIYAAIILSCSMFVVCGFGLVSLGSEKKKLLSLRATASILGTTLSMGIMLMIGLGTAWAGAARVLDSRMEQTFYISPFVSWPMLWAGTLLYGITLFKLYLDKPPRLTIEHR
ncbi:hypothetical protein KW800_02700 [Candidatus Parcubacteria bacterium]|nr:hypothetical protein [Candidatus Parcubacteria bacterium]